VQHRLPHFHTRRDIQLISIIGYLVGAEIEMSRLEAQNAKFAKARPVHTIQPNT
jgi:hypothetical protein